MQRKSSEQSRPRFTFVAALVAVLLIGGYQYNGQRAQARMQAAKAVTLAKEAEANEAEAKAPAAVAQIEQQREGKQKSHEEQLRQQREADLARTGAEHRLEPLALLLDTELAFGHLRISGPQTQKLTNR
jgi:hypothetical protein